MARHFLNILAAALLLAMAPSGLMAIENIGSSGKTNEFYKSAASSCPSATSQTTLEINNIRTILLNGGDLWWDLNDARFEVPKIDPPGSSPSINSLFAGAVWLGGIDAGGNLKIAAQTYRQTGNDFWPGPLDPTATINVQTCQDYDRHWVVYGEDIANFLNESFPCSDCCDRYPAICEWPGKGNLNAKGKGDVSLVVLDELAPYNDVNGNGVYDPIDGGDYPVINPTCGNNYADQMIFWVYNDKGNIHTETGGQAIGVQVGALAFAFKTSDEVNNMTFYRYDILNKGNVPIGDFYMGQWVDADLGCFNNDYVGCDTSLSLGFAYNGLSTDPDCATKGYGVSVPIIGVDYFEGPFSGGVDGAGNPVKLGMSTFLYYDNDFTITGNPQTAINYYNYMAGFWKDGSPFTSDRCNGYGGTIPTKYMFPSEPGGPAFPASWSECSCNNPAADRRWMQASGPFILQPGARNFITVGTVWVRQGTQSSCAADIDLLRSADIKAQALFNNCFKLVDGPDAPTLVIRELDKELIIMLENRRGSNNITFDTLGNATDDSYNEVDPLAYELYLTFPQLIKDTTYTFQGYILYQLKNSQVTAEDFSDPTLARVIAQVDVEDNVSKIVNKELIRTICGEVPTLMVDGSNAGIRRSFRIKEDLFATGNTELVNHKNYYFTAVAYAYNYYSTGVTGLEETDCGPVPILEEQKNPYLQGRRNQAVYSAIPHKPEGADGGTILNSEFGDLLPITRIDGTGNGGFNLELTQESVDAIIASANGAYGPIEYIGGNAPIQVKVVDPMKVRAQSFRLFFDEADSTTQIDTATGFLDVKSRWELYCIEDDTTYRSTISLAQLNEQIIEKYGISISLTQVANVGDQDQIDLGYLTSSIEYEDEVNQWLQFVPDGGSGENLTNWIRSGQSKEKDDNAPNGHFFDDHYWRCVCCKSPQPNCEDIVTFYDPQQEFNNIVGGTFAPYALAANKVNTSLTDPADPKWSTNFTYGPGFLVNFTLNTQTNTPVLVPNTKSLNMLPPSYNLDSLVSINLVFTNDKSKWTRCVVVETGEDFATNEGGSFKGQIRNTPSVDINGFQILADTNEIGRSYFPGYAINVETGERLNMMFGENSFAVGENGRDMIWNPSKNVLSPLRQVLFGGGHYVYIMNTKYDEGEELQRIMRDNIGLDGFERPAGGGVNKVVTSKLNDSVYMNILYTAIPFVNPEQNLLSLQDGLVPSKVTVKIRVRKPLDQYVATGQNNGFPMYEFNTDGLAVETDLTDVAKNHLDQIRVVPNPYYAYSAYETSDLDNRIKITNLPGTCTVTIYSIDGVLIRQFKRDVGPNTHYGENTNAKTNLDNSLDWDLKNVKNIPVSSGVYLIHVEAPGIGERTVKWFGVMRPFDLGTF